MTISSYNRPETLLGELCEVVSVVYQKTSAASLSTFFDTFNPLMFILTPRDGSQRGNTFCYSILYIYLCLLLFKKQVTLLQLWHKCK